MAQPKYTGNIQGRAKQKKDINYLKFRLFYKSSKFEVEKEVEAKVHSCKVFRNRKFNFVKCNSFPSKQQPFLSLQMHPIKHNKFSFQFPYLPKEINGYIVKSISGSLIVIHTL